MKTINDKFYIREVDKREIPMICQMIEKIYFLPKVTWQTSLSDMASNGLQSGKWKGIGLYNMQDELMAYLDYKVKDEAIEIGICFTIEEYRNNHLMRELIQFLVEKNSNMTIEIGTYEKNRSMRRCCERLGFKEKERKADRIDGTNSIYYELKKCDND